MTLKIGKIRIHKSITGMHGAVMVESVSPENIIEGEVLRYDKNDEYHIEYWNLFWCNFGRCNIIQLLILTLELTIDIT